MGQSEHAEATPDRQDAARRAAISDLPPSAKLVVKALEHEGDLSQQELADETLLPPRTVRYALGRLRDEDVVESQFSFVDARKRKYTLAD
jgi:DNA-binding MarR family transcriptional regulator